MLLTVHVFQIHTFKINSLKAYATPWRTQLHVNLIYTSERQKQHGQITLGLSQPSAECYVRTSLHVAASLFFQNTFPFTWFTQCLHVSHVHPFQVSISVFPLSFWTASHTAAILFLSKQRHPILPCFRHTKPWLVRNIVSTLHAQ